MLDYYTKFKPEIQWTAKYKARTLGGVRDALRQLTLAEPSTRLCGRTFYFSGRAIFTIMSYAWGIDVFIAQML